MKQKFGKSFILIPIGLFISAVALTVLVTMQVPDFLIGALMGAGIGLASLPFIVMKVKASQY